jgi:uncharacterized damage-inducible protein DinB
LVQEVAARYLEEYEEKIRLVVGRLSEEQVWWRPGKGDEAAGRVNSIGNLLLHLCGNLSLWVLAGIGGESYERHRSAEFAARHTHGRDRLLEDLSAVVRRAAAVLRRLDEEDLERYLSIQGYTTNVLGAAFHAVEHMSYHTGQILLLTKQQLAAGEEIELYPQHRGE